jgi:uncharacterized protein YbjT (DUF2867 family)
MAHVGVLGASGYVGSHLVPALVDAGHSVRAMARHRDVLAARGWAGVEVTRADAMDLETLHEAFAGLDVVYHLVHSMGSGGDFASRDRQIADNVAAAAAQAGVQRIIYLGGLQPGGSASEHLSSRRETGERLRQGSVPVTELRAGIIVGAGSAAFEVIRDLTYHLPVMLTPRWVRSTSQPIALDDVVSYLVRVLDVEETAGRIYDVAGPEVIEYGDLLRQFGEIVGRHPKLIPLPVLSPRLSSYWLDLVTAVPASVARPLIDGLKHDLLADDDEIRLLIPLPLLTYREAVAAALEQEREERVPARWSEGVLAFRDDRADVAYYSRGATAEVETDASPERLWDAVRSVGGASGWGYMNWAWRVRGAVDRMIGGIGMRRGRRHPIDVRVGDAIDFWRVVAVEPGQRLTLLAEMKLPGAAVLELEVRPREGGSTLVTTARFHPAGVVGLLYWYLLWPVHMLIFPGLSRSIAARIPEDVPKVSRR